MPDRKKVIYALECLSLKSEIIAGRCICDECAYEEASESFIDCVHRVSADALELLKLQEPKPVKIIKNAYNHEFYYCPNCDRGFVDTYYKRPLFCDECGQAVKWDGIG